jgi:hypothetical protein
MPLSPTCVTFERGGEGGVEGVGTRRTRTWRTGEVARVVGLSRQTLHRWAALGLIRPVRTTPGGHRHFSGGVFRRIEAIQAARATRTLGELAAQRTGGRRGRHG